MRGPETQHVDDVEGSVGEREHECSNSNLGEKDYLNADGFPHL